MRGLGLMTDHPESVSDRLRRALALPIYTISLLLSLLGDGLGILAAKIAGDDWPR
jgi:hypothetical protein